MADRVDKQYINAYVCPVCGTEWTDMYDAVPDMDCPECGTRHIQAWNSVDIATAASLMSASPLELLRLALSRLSDMDMRQVVQIMDQFPLTTGGKLNRLLTVLTRVYGTKHGKEGKTTSNTVTAATAARKAKPVRRSR